MPVCQRLWIVDREFVPTTLASRKDVFSIQFLPCTLNVRPVFFVLQKVDWVSNRLATNSASPISRTRTGIANTFNCR